VRCGLRDRSDGQVELACPSDVEAWFFECGVRAADLVRALSTR
jgi:hypothetical protein